MKIKMQEIAEFQVTAVHYNTSPPLSAELESVEHLHTFLFKCKRELTPLLRNWSAKNFQGGCKEFIEDQFGDHRYGVLNFEGNSCISLAELLISRLSLSYCSVTEMGVGGIEIFVEQGSESQIVVENTLPNRIQKIFGGQLP